MKVKENQKHIYEVDTSGENQDIRSSVTSACTSPPRSLREFTFPELWDATTGFSIYNLLGEGGFGPVYKGHIEGLDIAVKRLNAEGCQGHKEWRTEVESLGRLHHPNIVQLIGLCSEQDQHLLIYEYISMGSLEHILMDGGCKLNWERRLRIVTGIAKGLAYLHEQQPPIIHRDLKPSNILLDLNYNAKLCDFGLARDGPTTTRSHVSTRVMGTHAYVDPEYQESGHLKVGCDVYGFGVVLLQILTGQSPMLRAPSGKERSIAEWARPWLRCKDRYKIREIMDPRLYEEYPIESASRVGRIADHCTRDIRWRLRADQIVQFLEQCRS